MGASAAEIRDLADLEAALASSGAGPLTVVIDAPVPPWLVDAVARLRRTDRALQVRLVAANAVGEEQAGHEIGMLVAILDAGVHPDEIHGPAPERVRRVAEVLQLWDRQFDAGRGGTGVIG